MRLRIELEREDDGRWIAEVPELPGVLAYGATEDEARGAVIRLMLKVASERLENGEPIPESALNAAFQLAHAS